MTDARPLAVYTDSDDLDVSEGVELLSTSGFRVKVLQSRDAEVIADAAADATVLLVGYAPIDRDLLRRLPALKVISLLSRGFDNIDVEAATQQGIWVCTVGEAAAEEVSTHAWTMTLAMIRQLPFFAGFPHTREWTERPAVLPRRVSELTVGVLGLGSTGRRYAALAAATGARRVLGFDIRSNRPAHPDGRHLLHGIEGAEVTDLDTVLAVSDVISLHLPLTADTKHIINASNLSRMRPGSYLINISRGSLVNSDHLLAALDSGLLAGAALDVFATEPPPADDPLLNHPHVLSTPHIAYLSDATQAHYVNAQARNVVHWVQSGTPALAVNQVVSTPC